MGETITTVVTRERLMLTQKLLTFVFIRPTNIFVLPRLMVVLLSLVGLRRNSGYNRFLVFKAPTMTTKRKKKNNRLQPYIPTVLFMLPVQRQAVCLYGTLRTR